MEQAITIDEIKKYEEFKKHVGKLSYEDLSIIRNELMNSGKEKSREYQLVNSIMTQQYIGNGELYEQIKEHLKKMELPEIVKWFNEVEMADVRDRRLYELIRDEIDHRTNDKSTKKSG